MAKHLADIEFVIIASGRNFPFIHLRRYSADEDQLFPRVFASVQVIQSIRRSLDTT
jgi:hypothetical protein